MTVRERGRIEEKELLPERERDFNVSKDFPITVSDTLHTQLTIGPTLTAAQIG